MGKMTPQQAGFDNTIGFRLPNLGSNTRVKLMSNVANPCLDTQHYRDQLIWHTPPDAEPMLLYCNGSGQWFNLEFNPIS
jgi:hypothetical protein